MTIMKITVNLAFQDCIGASVDNVRNLIINHALDGFEAEVAFTSDVSERQISIADPDFNADDADNSIEAWQERARAEMGDGSVAQSRQLASWGVTDPVRK